MDLQRKIISLHTYKRSVTSAEKAFVNQCLVHGRGTFRKMAEKYNASNIALEQILNYIKSGEIAIPEIQRPFVWKPRQVKDLIDSLYTGYPTGYLIISQSPNIKLKDGTLAEGKKIINERLGQFARWT